MQVFCGGISPFSAKFFPGPEYKKSAEGISLRARTSISAAAVVAATIVAAVIPTATPAATAEQDDDEQDDPQAAVAAPTVIAAPHYEYLLIMKVLRGLFAALDTIIWQKIQIGALLYKMFSQKARSIVAISARVALR